MRSAFRRNVVLWLIYEGYLWILHLPVLLSAGKSGGVPAAAAWTLLLVLSLLPAKLAAVYIGVPPVISRVVYGRPSWWVLIARLLLGVLSGIALYRLAIHLLIYPYILEQSLGWDEFLRLNRMLSNLAEIIVPMLLFGAIWIYDEHLRSERRALQISHEKLDLEMQFLRSQTNPHFLFNTINSIYGMVRQQQEAAGPALLKLSAVLRYLLYESSAHRVPLSAEIELIGHYVALQKLRFGDGLDLRMKITETDPLWSIAPGLLLPLVENAFKWVETDDRDLRCIEILAGMREAGRFDFEVSNHVRSGATVTEGGIGLKNLTRQLQLQYEGRYSFSTEVKGGSFVARLTLYLENL